MRCKIRVFSSVARGFSAPTARSASSTLVLYSNEQRSHPLQEGRNLGRESKTPNGKTREENKERRKAPFQAFARTYSPSRRERGDADALSATNRQTDRSSASKGESSCGWEVREISQRILKLRLSFFLFSSCFSRKYALGAGRILASFNGLRAVKREHQRFCNQCLRQ